VPGGTKREEKARGKKTVGMKSLREVGRPRATEGHYKGWKKGKMRVRTVQRGKHGKRKATFGGPKPPSYAFRPVGRGADRGGARCKVTFG